MLNNATGTSVSATKGTRVQVTFVQVTHANHKRGLLYLECRPQPFDRHRMNLPCDMLPIVSAWVASSIDRLNAAAQEQEMPFSARILSPEISNTFWVNLIGRGYPAPRHKFRWCTER